ncbi:hypothetical protein SDRG_00729 [Saprolegnia diclina VS20]|uniref:UDENN domain-containing protein n=1 Tax=Saprolegnia diclina (strain VS20) TaxID=1156394 RepID=T0S973_SAPDV|nr:hypothetical protein SDRG_00729 [Saprolegnia diclina VS20]EQC41873.1 hypothetical protein SDRG_00729 [Saprolegnia diclina VS20]|eukprot:XP_008604442.1 hypothetical protein SDRG_00729 [Saprolegnia diclina VS20]
MNFLTAIKKPEHLDSWLFGDDVADPRPPLAPTANRSTPASPAAADHRPSSASTKLAQAATMIQDKYKKMAKNNMNYKTISSSYPMPLSKKFRKYLRDKQRAETAIDEKQRRLLQLSEVSRLRAHTPFSLHEIVKDPKKLPYLLDFLAKTTDDGNYHNVLLFLLELEQERDAARGTPSLLKLFNKYFTTKSECSISATLELTPELEEMVLASIQNDDIGWVGFRPIQRLAFKRLTREELPRFLKSTEYLEMLQVSEHTAAFVPLDRFLTNPRAAHYFLLFLMQQRQHFELYFWLHVEYVLKKCTSDMTLFWTLTHDLLKKARVDSSAIQAPTKANLADALQIQSKDAALAAFGVAQAEICLVLSASWYERFVKSPLYTLALSDKAAKTLLDSDSDSDDDDDEHHQDTDKRRSTAMLRDSFSEYDSISDIPNSERPPLVHHVESEDSDSDDEAPTSMRLNLESIIRSTSLPDGLQVHYRPNYPLTPLVLREDLVSTPVIDAIVLFKTITTENSGTRLELSYVRKDKSPALPPSPESQRKVSDLAKRIQPYFVPHGKLIVTGVPELDVLFPFVVLQNGDLGTLYCMCYTTYVARGDAEFVAQGVCVASPFPLIDGLRSIVARHLLDTPTPLLPDHVRRLYTVPAPSPTSAPLPTPSPNALLHRRHSGTLLDLPAPPRIDFGLAPLFATLSNALVLEVVANALLEHSIILLSSSLSALTLSAEAIRCLLAPFAWCHIYIPVLPKSLLSYLHCPTPILVGIHQSCATRDDLPLPSPSSCAIVVDLDRGTLEYLGPRKLQWPNMGLLDDASSPIRLVDAFTTAKAQLDTLLVCPSALQLDAVGLRPSSALPTAFPDADVRGVFYKLVANLLFDHTAASLVVGDATESVIIFDEHKFTALRPAYETPFIECLIRTQCFSEIISTHRLDARLEGH